MRGGATGDALVAESENLRDQTPHFSPGVSVQGAGWGIRPAQILGISE